MAKQTDKIREKWEKDGWYCINLIATNKKGIPDYQMIKKGETDVFVESKEKHDNLSELQKLVINKLISLGKRVFVNDTELFHPFEFEEFDF